MPSSSEPARPAMPRATAVGAFLEGWRRVLAAPALTLGVMAATGDGFKIAEEDLKLRGPGDLLGQAQSGLPPLRFGDLAEDRHLIESARSLVSQSL